MSERWRASFRSTPPWIVQRLVAGHYNETTLVKTKTANGIECWFVTCHMLLPALPVEAVLRNGSFVD
jgi:hypothetical protein